MTDDQLQSLFAGMERHLDKRAEALKEYVADAVATLEARIDAKIERVETTLLAEFHKWASPLESRVRTHSTFLRTLDLDLEYLKERVQKLEGEKPPQ